MSCNVTCPIYYYGNNTYAECLACVSPCVACLSLTLCISCINNTYLFNNRCISVCPSGYYPNNTINTCTLCSTPCATCTTILPT